jgi:hypothetical protein
VTDASGCSRCDSIVISFTTGVVSLTEPTPIDIFPNPNHGEFTVSGLDFLVNELEIHNAYGQLVYRKTATRRQETISISSIPSGVYFVTIKNEHLFKVKKFIME